MDCRANSDVFFLPDEKFDFDVSLSPTSSKEDEDEDEVFIGPLSHKEKCVSVNVVSRLENNVGDVRSSWSPLTGDQLDAVCQEAHKLADKLQSGELSRSHSEDDVTTGATTDREQFVQDAQAKMGVLGQTASALSPVKRETFCVQDSPMKLLPPAVQRRMLRGSSAGTASSARPATAASSTRPAATASSARPAAKTRLSTSSPVPGVRAQPRMGLRGKAVLGVVLPSKPAAPTPSCSASKSRAEKGRLQPPTKAVGGWKRSPSSRSSSRPSSRAASCEDLLSDSASVASDISDSSLNSSLIGKRTLAPPTKNIVRNVTGVKAVPPQSRRVSERKNTSSSSSSVSSFNSSISLSPAKGKLNSSLNRSLNGSTGPASSSVSIQANKPRRSTIYATAEPASANASRRSLSTQARKPSEVERVKAVRSTPLKRAEATPLQATPAKRLMERTASIPTTAVVRPQTGPRTRSKPEALVPPTPSGGSRGAPSGDDGSKMLKPKRLMSASNVDSLPQKPSVGPLTPSAGSCRLLQVKARRPSALPTPVRRRMSSIPVATPTNPGRTARPPSVSDCDPAAGSASPRTERSCSPAPVVTQEEAPADAPDIQPFCLEEEEEEHPAALPSTPPQSDQSESTVPEALSHGESEPNKNLIELETAEESNSKTQEVLLLDLPAPTLQPQEKLLIDLTNTPNLIRTSNKSCTTTQLIDLSSPLIKWSPEDKRENNAPLINLSF